MCREKVGNVTEKERDEIQKLFERRLALQELLMTLNKPSLSEEEKSGIYERIVADTGKNKINFDEWWSDMAQKYRWKAVENAQWVIDFKTREIFIVPNETCG